MKNTKCYLCGNTELKIIHKGTRDRKDLDVLKCPKCGLVCLSSFDHINNNFYEDSGMHQNNDIELMHWRERTKEDDERRAGMLESVIRGKEILDFGCGNGGFLNYARNIAQVEGVEIEKAARDELTKQGLTVYSDISESKLQYDIITLFHVLEHLNDPISYLKTIKEYLKDGSNSQIIIEIPNADDALLTIYESGKFADFTYWSPHLFLYNHENIGLLADKAGLKINFIKQIQRYPLANHLYWMAKGKPGGQKEWDILNSRELNKQYTSKLAELHACDTILFSVS